jgi:hypothetical protein
LCEIKEARDCKLFLSATSIAQRSTWLRNSDLIAIVKRAFARLRAMLDDPLFAYQHIANKFGVTRQYIAQLAKELGIDGMRRRRQCERSRMLRREPRVIKVEYPLSIRAVIDKIRRSGIQVTPYIFPPSQANVAWKSQKWWS